MLSIKRHAGKRYVPTRNSNYNFFTVIKLVFSYLMLNHKRKLRSKIRHNYDKLNRTVMQDIVCYRENEKNFEMSQIVIECNCYIFVL